jgi:hypothetical protein
MLKDQRDLLLAFNAHNVRYLVVGGYAYSHYTQPRATKDLDVFIDTSPKNAALVFKALARFGAPLAGMTPADFQGGGSWFQIGVALSRIDVIQSIDGVDFETAWNSRMAGFVDGTIPVHYISIDDLILNKRTVGRLRDLADVEDLEAARNELRKIDPTKDT